MTNSVHKCKIYCHSIDPTQADILGVLDDTGKWLPFAFHMDIVVACKLTTDEDDNETFGCTSVFTENGDTFILDTSYKIFQDLFLKYHNVETTVDPEPEL
jgi:hypothetical protein